MFDNEEPWWACEEACRALVEACAEAFVEYRNWARDRAWSLIQTLTLNRLSDVVAGFRTESQGCHHSLEIDVECECSCWVAVA